MNIEEIYQHYLQHPSIQTDTRKLKQGDFFFALKGPNFNANELAAKALELGAAYAVIDDKNYFIDERTILVDDVLTTLQQLALHHRQQFTIPFIAITGSNGKTTTKELVHAVLSAQYKTYTTQGNLNNHIGIPLTILRIQKDAEMAVIEMGANHLKEIEGYCQYTKPTHGIITNCGKAHLEGFGSIEGVRKAKGELYDYLRAHNGTAFVMWDYDYLQTMSKGIATIIKYGTNADADISGNVIESEKFLAITVTKGVSIPLVQTKLVGNYNLPNVLAAVTIANHFNIPANKIKNSIEQYIPSNNRSQLIEQGTNKIILDAYNANPSSLRLAIENLAAMKVADKVLLLGAMAELGNESIEEHKTIVQQISNHNWKAVALVGGDFLKIKHPYASLENATKAKDWFQQQQFENATILIKGSRSIGMETIISK